MPLKSPGLATRAPKSLNPPTLSALLRDILMRDVSRYGLRAIARCIGWRHRRLDYFLQGKNVTGTGLDNLVRYVELKPRLEIKDGEKIYPEKMIHPNDPTGGIDQRSYTSRKRRRSKKGYFLKTRRRKKVPKSP